MKRIALLALGTTGCIQPIVETNPFVESGDRLPTWTLQDVRGADTLAEVDVSPDDYASHVSLYYFGHAT